MSAPDILPLREAENMESQGELIGIDISPSDYNDVLFWLNDRKFIKLKSREWFDNKTILTPTTRVVMSIPIMTPSDKMVHRFYFSNEHRDIAMEFRLTFG